MDGFNETFKISETKSKKPGRECDSYFITINSWVKK